MEFKNRSPRRKPMFDDIPSARWLDDSVWEKTRRRDAVQTDRPAKKRDDSGVSKVRRDFKKPSLNLGQYYTKFRSSRATRFVLEQINLIYKFVKGLPSAPAKFLYIKKHYRQAVALLICLIAVLVVPLTIIETGEKTDQSVAGTSTNSTADPNAPTNEPLFEIIKPAGRELKKEDVIFDPQRKFAKFTDEINGIPAIISQQPLPEIYRTNPADGAAKIAKDFGASELISVDGQQVYFGQDEKGPMTMIFAKNGNLVFVSTTKAVDKEALKVYVGNFE